MRIGRGRALKEHQKWFEEKALDRYNYLYYTYTTLVHMHLGRDNPIKRMDILFYPSQSILPFQTNRRTDFTLCRLKG